MVRPTASRTVRPRSLAIAVATPLFLYVVFERLFEVTLPHGALAAAFGY